MAEYRIYKLDGWGTKPPVIRHHESDQAAIEAASSEFPREGLEIWQAARLVHVVPRP